MRRAVTGSDFERSQYTILGFVVLAGGKIGLREIELGTRLVDRIRSQHRVVLANCAVELFLRVEQIAEVAMQIFIFDRVDIVHALKRCDGFGGLAGGFFECREPLEQDLAIGRPACSYAVRAAISDLASPSKAAVSAISS